MDGVCASVREAHIQGDNEQVHQKDGVCRERSATDVPSITKSCGYAVSSARSGTDLTELWSAYTRLKYARILWSVDGRGDCARKHSRTVRTMP